MNNRYRFALFAIFYATTAGIAAAQHNFGYYHPDLENREAGLRYYEKKDYITAHERFMTAAKFGDKGSQAMLAEIYWQGLGVERDPVLAYIFSDLAAERGYPILVAKRENYWANLSETERKEAASRGQDIYSEFGDVVAKPRLEERLREGLSKATGTRVGGGVTGNLVFTNVWDAEFKGGNLVVEGARRSNYYHPNHWSPEAYWAAQDRAWDRAETPTGRVEIGALRSVAEPAEAAPPNGN